LSLESFWDVWMEIPQTTIVGHVLIYAFSCSQYTEWSLQTDFLSLLWNHLHLTILTLSAHSSWGKLNEMGRTVDYFIF
jgi:hypothetical protein